MRTSFCQWLVGWGLVCLLAFVGITSIAYAGTTRAKHRWKIGTLAPKGVGWAVTFERVLLPIARDCSENQLRLKIYWGGVMGDDEDYIRKMHIGQLQGAGLSAQGSTLACPEFAVVELPFLFQGPDEVDYVRERMYDTFDYYFGQYGFKLLFWIDQDFDQLYSSNSPLADLKEFDTTKFVTWYGPLEEALFKSLGAEATNLSMPEIPAAVRMGAVDSVIAPAVWVVGSQLYSKFNYVNPIRIRYSPAALVVTTEAWDSIPQRYRDCLAERRSVLEAQYNKATRSDNRKTFRRSFPMA